MTNPYLLTDTISLIQAAEQIIPPASYLTDTFFSQKIPAGSSGTVAVEYRKGKRILAPYIVKGSRGVEIERTAGSAKLYTAPMIGARRVLSAIDLEMRQFGEQPLYSTVTPQERAAQVQARDLSEIISAISNRKNKMAADILLEGKTVIEGYADDGAEILEDEIDFSFQGIQIPTVKWSNDGAKIYDDIKAAVDKIAEDTGELPDIMVCGANIEKYFLQNKQIKDFLLVTNRLNLTIGGITPKFLSPQTRYLGTIPALGLEMYSYLETYFEGGNTKPFIPADSVIIAKAGRGKQIFGAVTLIDRITGVQTYSAEIVPHYFTDERAQTISVSAYSRCILAPDAIDSWIHIKSCGNA